MRLSIGKSERVVVTIIEEGSTYMGGGVVLCLAVFERWIKVVRMYLLRGHIHTYIESRVHNFVF